MRIVEMKNIIIGTAGHIDHGKTALVRALTGIDTDRLKEEKKRGISIDLGFAHLQLSENVRLGLVDVPGHERFIKNMLAGVSGIDLVLFVIASDESIKPQTREHFDICMLLGIRKGIVVLTKADLAQGDLLELARLEAGEFVRGSFLEDAPMVAVSAATGAGLDELRAELAKMAATVAEKDASQYFRLPIDRVFSVKGFGTVVTGTLISGSVAKEQTVEVYPRERLLRVRGVQVHDQPAERAVAGQRTANLSANQRAEKEPRQRCASSRLRRMGGRPRRTESKPLVKLRPASPPRNVANCDGDGLFLANEDHKSLATRHAGVEEISLQHCVVLGQDRDDHGRIFGALALVDGSGVGGNQRV